MRPEAGCIDQEIEKVQWCHDTCRACDGTCACACVSVPVWTLIPQTRPKQAVGDFLLAPGQAGSRPALPHTSPAPQDDMR